tara:strand:+ start:2695 stop:3714 length:1020 start_codon:yes stop_codon:yes gene_type:complete
MGFELKQDSFDRTFIVEACDNHFGSLDSAKAFVDGADRVGAQYIKFQHHITYEEMDKTEDMSSNFLEPLHIFLDRCALTLNDHIYLIKYCRDKNVDYLVTPFSFQAFLELYSLGVRLFKIGSGEFQDLLFLSKLSDYKDCFFIFSTGMCAEHEIIDLVDFLNLYQFNFSLMNCVSEYPPELGNPNFRYISRLKKLFPNLLIGQSDHSPSIGSSLAAITLGASIIEKHVTLNPLLSGPDKDVSITFESFRELIDLSKDISPKDFSKSVSSKELNVRKWAYRGIVASCDIQKGDTLDLDKLTSKRPSNGIPSNEFSKLIGCKTNRMILKGQRLCWDDVKSK